MLAFLANLFGYVLNFLYETVGNYGLAIILFSILVKLIMLPISISQQKTMEKSKKVNKEMQRIQFVYKNDPEKMNQEVMDLYKREQMSPFSGCLSSIIQIILLFSVFFLVRSPLTYMKKIDTDTISKLETVVEEAGYTSNYVEIAIINYFNNLENETLEEENIESEDEENSEEISTDAQTNNEEMSEDEKDTETEAVDESDSSDEMINVLDYKDEVYINMEFLGLDLSKVPTENLDNLSVLIIPALYVISSLISLRMTNNANGTNKKSNKEKNLIGDGTEGKNNKVKEKKDGVEQGEKTDEVEGEVEDPMAQANKSMNLMMPIMSVLIACIAPLGLALYWLMNNILTITERLVLKKVLKKEEANEDA